MRMTAFWASSRLVAAPLLSVVVDVSLVGTGFDSGVLVAAGSTGFGVFTAGASVGVDGDNILQAIEKTISPQRNRKSIGLRCIEILQHEYDENRNLTNALPEQNPGIGDKMIVQNPNRKGKHNLGCNHARFIEFG
jgi:hypothetical protein